MYSMNWDWFFFSEDDDEWPFNMNRRRNRRVPSPYRFNRPHYIGNPMKTWKDILREAMPKIREQMDEARANGEIVSNETRITMKREGRTFQITIKEVVDESEDSEEEEEEAENIAAEDSDFDEDFAEENA